MMPGRSIISPTLIPDRSSLSKCPSSMRMPAHVWQRLSVGGWSPRDKTQGQNTVQLHDKASSPFRLQLSRNVPLPFLVFNLVPLCGKCRHRNTRSNDNQRHANTVREAPSRQQLFNCHHRGKPGHPGHIHHPNRKHHHHHRPAASETVKPLLHPETEYAAERRGPVREKERKRILAMRETSMFERRELIDACADENGPRQNPARRRNSGIEQCGTRESNLHRGRKECKDEPHACVSCRDHERRYDSLAFARGGFGDFRVSQDHG